MSKYFPKPRSLGKNVKVVLGLYNYSAKSDLKNATDVDTSDFAKNIDLFNLKSDTDKLNTDKLKKSVSSGLNILKSNVDKLDVDKLVAVPVDLNKLIDAVKNFVEKDLYIFIYIYIYIYIYMMS